MRGVYIVLIKLAKTALNAYKIRETCIMIKILLNFIDKKVMIDNDWLSKKKVGVVNVYVQYLLTSTRKLYKYENLKSCLNILKQLIYDHIKTCLLKCQYENVWIIIQLMYEWNVYYKMKNNKQQSVWLKNTIQIIR